MKKIEKKNKKENLKKTQKKMVVDDVRDLRESARDMLK